MRRVPPACLFTTLAVVGCSVAGGAAAQLDETGRSTPRVDRSAVEGVDEASFGPRFTPTLLSVFWDNDGYYLRPGGTDRHYTNGAGLSLAGRVAWADDVAAMLPGREAFAGGTAAVGVLVGHEIFTPDNILVAVPDPVDRPYAGYLYAGFYVQRQADLRDSVGPNGRADAVFDHVQLDLGIIGPSSYADKIQTEVHREFDRNRIPQGWGAQLGDEPTAQVTWTRKWRYEIGSVDWDWAGQTLALQAIPHTRLRLGTVYVDAEAGARVRLGHNLPDDFGPGTLREPSAVTGGYGRGAFWSVDAAASVRVVGHNLFLDGGTFESGPSVDTNSIVGRAELGVTVGYVGDNGALIATHVSYWFESPEFGSQQDNDNVARWTVMIGWGF